MPYNRPTLTQLIERIQADFAAVNPAGGPTAQLRRAVLRALARAWAGVTHGLHGHLAFLARRLHPYTAEDESLERWAAIWQVYRLAAAPASGEVVFSGTDGAVIPAATVLQNAEGVEYGTDGEAIIAGGSATVAVTALAGGLAANAEAGAVLSLASPIAGVQSSAEVAAGGLTGGTDQETLAALRDRWHRRVQRRAEGGSVDGYDEWAREVPGVTRVWVIKRWQGLGTVGVFFMRDDDPDPIPGAADVAAVQAHIAPLLPADMDDGGLYVLAPAPSPADMTIGLSPNTAAVRAAVEDELTDLFRRQAAVEDGSGSGVVLISQVRAAISVADGVVDYHLSLDANLAPDPGEIVTLGGLAFGDL